MLKSVSVVIPTLNAERYLPELLPAILAADPLEVILVDSMSKDATCEIAAKFDKVRTMPIHNFSHGRSRNMGAAEAVGDVVVFLSQDATPEGADWMPELVAPFSDETVAYTYSRQVPYKDANPMEQFFLADRFPAGEPIRRVRPEGRGMTIEDTFCSNVSSAVRREVLLKHPFDEEVIMSEDQQFSRDVLEAGYVVVYTPDSVVRHSHNYSLNVCMKRYFDSVYSLRKLFPAHSMNTTVSTGGGYVGRELGFMIKKYPLWLPYYFIYTAAKVLGALLAHFGDQLPKWLVRRVSLHAYYWD